MSDGPGKCDPKSDLRMWLVFTFLEAFGGCVCLRDYLNGLGRVGLGSRSGASGRHRARARLIFK